MLMGDCFVPMAQAEFAASKVAHLKGPYVPSQFHLYGRGRDSYPVV